MKINRVDWEEAYCHHYGPFNLKFKSKILIYYYMINFEWDYDSIRYAWDSYYEN